MSLAILNRILLMSLWETQNYLISKHSSAFFLHEILQASNPKARLSSSLSFFFLHPLEYNTLANDTWPTLASGSFDDPDLDQRIRHFLRRLPDVQQISETVYNVSVLFTNFHRVLPWTLSSFPLVRVVFFISARSCVTQSLACSLGTINCVVHL